MKTAHRLAAELLIGPNLPIWHFDPSRAGLDSDRDTSLSEPEVQVNDSREGLTEEEIESFEGEGCFMGKFLTICGETGEEGEALTDRESDLARALERANGLCRSMYAVAIREGQKTNWTGLVDQLAAALLEQHKLMFPDQYLKLSGTKVA